MDAPAPPLPLLVYDGDCALCERLAHRARGLVGRRHVVASQSLDPAQWGLTREDFGRSVWWIPEQGQPLSEHEAVAAALRRGRAPWSWLGRLLVLWPVSLLARRGYRLVANNRRLFGSPSCAVPSRDGDAPQS